VKSDTETTFEKTMPNRKLTIGTLAVGLVLILSASLNAYFIRIDGGGDVLWNDKEAYLFIASNNLGHHVKWIGYPLLIVGEILGRIDPPDDSSGSMYVIRVTSSGVERHVFELTDRRPAADRAGIRRLMVGFGRITQQSAVSAGGRATTSSQQHRKSYKGLMASTISRTMCLRTRTDGPRTQ